ncbi:MAG: FAD-binding protein, partial [bacterium]
MNTGVTATDWEPLRKALGGRLSLGESLARHTAFRVGGPAEAWARADDEAQLLACLAFARERGLTITLLARGTNVLIRDGGVRGLVLGLGGTFDSFEISGTRLRAGSAMNLALLARKTALAGLKGLEWAVGIPGS